ncbi:M20 family metallopeptidase [Thermopolyspora sp. NPDC052614]|uniref:M20 family metallopeptidase n=1 Tax=Thermopolyspora sp. NPDC052614 TaxID=3155682 RepID=UPI003441C33E
MVRLAQRLIRIDSCNPPGNEAWVARVLAEEADAAGLRVTTDEVAAGRTNVTVRLPGSGADPRTLVYCGHLDTVTVGTTPWTRDPFGAEVVDGLLWGRGSVDMKGGLAAMLSGMIAIRRSGVRLPGDVVLRALVGEEVDCAGAQHLLATGGMAEAAWMVVGEPTGLRAVVAHKGCARLRVVVRGVGAHASRPDVGVNAILKMARVLQELAAVDVSGPPHPLLTGSTSAATMISGGSALNVVPDACTVDFDIRTVPGQDHREIAARFEAVLADAARRDPDFQATVELTYDRAPVTISPDDALVTAVQGAAETVLGRCPEIGGVGFFTDASVLQPPTGVPTVVFGPGDVGLMHQTDERISVSELVDAARVFAVLPATLW